MDDEKFAELCARFYETDDELEAAELSKSITKELFEGRVNAPPEMNPPEGGSHA